MVVIRLRVAKRNKQQNEILAFVMHNIIWTKMSSIVRIACVERTDRQHHSLVLWFFVEHTVPGAVFFLQPFHKIEFLFSLANNVRASHERCSTMSYAQPIFSAIAFIHNFILEKKTHTGNPCGRQRSIYVCLLFFSLAITQNVIDSSTHSNLTAVDESVCLELVAELCWMLMSSDHRTKHKLNALQSGASRLWWRS